ncbi:MAG TPA: pyrimidine-nucleoside phosphorylase [Candidatus Pseudogracilibacillus intestinigallinarum]|uniref:Pyrimidine-nucleoside phosphorylase n=1 Tax=Candidatus Pseudogracilibacillus intestinigallinarum TaxID=2838742 RepID=A0A9D1PLL5_9BACI|nr:pyrimidine-nucleoside phosphorylase [Candidatus Pseudogracilibacillus intestinigallinarum]
MRMYDIIEKKRDGHVLTTEEINFVIEQYVANHIPDYQVSALLMAIYFQGMTIEESAALTMAIVHSGEEIDLSGIDGVKVDKHSTGGVGDTTTLVLAPLVASLGVPVAKMSGRGLGHTGGTIDKLEAIKGFHVEITNEQFIELVNQNKVAVIGQSTQLAPADKLLYSLRDVTATVSSIPLIASSIMSKKIASGANAIVLDVKVGTGAFMKNLDDARKLAKTMVQIGNEVGRKTTAIISSMEEPLGNAIGNAIEIQEAIETLRGEGPEDLTELSLELGAEMVVLADGSMTKEVAKQQLKEQLTNGKAIEMFKTFIEAQGGDGSIVDNVQNLPTARYTFDVLANEAGYVSHIVANEIGAAAMMLGAGRETKDSKIDLSVGVQLHKKVGEFVEKGDIICSLYANTENTTKVKEKISENIIISNDMPKKEPLIFDIISS